MEPAAPQSFAQRIARRLAGAIASCMALLHTPTARAQDTEVYRGMCDASAAVALDAQHFVVANDEDNVLRIYRRGRPDAVASLPLARFLQTPAKAESDIEGAARIGARIYWIASHGRNASGKARIERYRFFATDVDTQTFPPTLAPVAVPHLALLQQMIEAETLKPLRLAEAAQLAPEAPGGLNIEGLADTPDGQLLIGLRSPLRDGKALLVPLKNPAQLLAGQRAEFGAALALDLGGRGVRSIERVAEGYLLVAGPVADRGDFVVYRWSGLAQDVPKALAGPAMNTLRPEALFAWPNSAQVQLLSDDGGIESAGVACKDRPEAQRSFRGVEFTP